LEKLRQDAKQVKKKLKESQIKCAELKKKIIELQTTINKNQTIDTVKIKEQFQILIKSLKQEKTELQNKS
jgi:hypothetical protein